MAYLQAMGVDSYVSRVQVPGAAPTQRLAIVPVTPPAASGISMEGLIPEGRATKGRATKGRAADGRAPNFAPVGPEGPETSPVPRLDLSAAPSAATASSVDSSPAGQGTAQEQSVAPFSMTAIIAGGLLWLEDLESGVLAREQVQLVQAMSRALAVASSTAGAPALGAVPVDVSQFDWPMHNNRQLGLGKDAVAASLAGFVGRRLENNCSGLVLLGLGACALVPLDQLDCGRVVKTSSTASMLSSPEIKQQVWRDLLPLLRD